MGGTGGTDDDIGECEPVIEFGEVNGISTEFFCEQFCAFAAAIGDDEVFNAFGLEVDECFFGHFACADYKHEFVVEAAENTAGEVADGDAGDGDTAICESSFGADLSGDFESTLEEDIGERTAGFVVLSDAVGFLHLVDDLRFSEDHAVDAAGDVEQVSDGFCAGECGEGGGEVFCGKIMDAAKEAEDIVGGKSLSGLFVCRIDFDSIAGREDNKFGAGVELFPAVVGVGKFLWGGESEPFTELDSGAVVAAADGQHIHGAAPVWPEDFAAAL